ncbi:MAG: GGDEF domain-containing protein [Ketobacteraceae bacterium]|nr:GGDEF domain-containing protein [Ketobacteraceae bacterium]
MEQELSETASVAEFAELVSQARQQIDNLDHADIDRLLDKLQAGIVCWEALDLEDAFAAIGLQPAQLEALQQQHPFDKTPILQKVLDELSRATLEDVLTGVYNRRYFQRSMAAELERSRRDQRPCGLVLLDIDHFKTFNDNYGHEVGDLVLKAVADEICNALRSTDTVSRVGGEEFAIIVPNTFRLDAGFLAERVRSNIEKLSVIHGENPLAVTASLGVSINDPRQNMTVDEIYRSADEALYEAKNAGRNCVRFSVSEAEKSSSAVTADERNELLG